MPRYTAVLDACVLVPVALADTLLRLAEKGLYRPLWSDRILAEAQEATEEIHPGIDISKRFTSMREAFGDAQRCQFAFVALIDRYTLVICPLTLGSGARLFEGPAPLTEFELTGSVATIKGVMIAQYTRR